MKLFNSMTRTKEEFVPIDENKVRMYNWGPTVYNFIHVGNARPLVVFDTLRRFFIYKGYDVDFVVNFTDIDDKLINRAIEEKTTVKDIAENTPQLKSYSVVEKSISYPMITNKTKIPDFTTFLLCRTGYPRTIKKHK